MRLSNTTDTADESDLLTHDVLAFPLGTLIRVNERVKYVDDELVVMVDKPHLYAPTRLGVLTKKRKIVYAMTDKVKVFTNYAHVAQEIPTIVFELIRKGKLSPEADIYVCTKDNAAAILATLVQAKVVNMQTPYTIRSVKQ